MRFAFLPLSRDIPDAWVVYLGRVSQVGQNKYEEKRFVSKISIHPQYNETILDSDVALMKLSSWVPFTDHIRPICLAGTSSQFYTSTPCWATGWAKNHKSGEWFQQQCLINAPPNPDKRAHLLNSISDEPRLYKPTISCHLMISQFLR